METGQHRGNKRKIVVSGHGTYGAGSLPWNTPFNGVWSSAGRGGWKVLGGGEGREQCVQVIRFSIRCAQQQLRAEICGGNSPLPTTSERSDEGGLRLTGIREASKSAVLNWKTSMPSFSDTWEVSLRCVQSGWEISERSYRKLLHVCETFEILSTV